ncbi:MAG: hypothetical protein QOD77_1966 [Thermoplasmata archaeon]|jgi:hypothetical protein|nr:hypothetical protein [Thermoplasmata archaeon]
MQGSRRLRTIALRALPASMALLLLLPGCLEEPQKGDGASVHAPYDKCATRLGGYNVTCTAWQPPAASQENVPDGWECIGVQERDQVVHRLWRSSTDEVGLEMAFDGPEKFHDQHGTLDVSWGGGPASRVWLHIGKHAFVPLGPAAGSFVSIEAKTFSFVATADPGWEPEVRMQAVEDAAWYTLEVASASEALFLHPMEMDSAGKPFPSLGQNQWNLTDLVVDLEVAQTRGDGFTFEVPERPPVPVQNPLENPPCG